MNSISIHLRYILLLLVCLLLAGLLAGCNDDDTATAQARLPVAPTLPAVQPGQPLQTPPGGGPLVGADGQITVVAPPPNGQNLDGQYFWVKENNLWQSGAGVAGGAPFTKRDLGGKQLTKVADLATAQSPALSPDGTTLVYAYSPEPEGSGANIVIGQDIYQYDLKSGTNGLLLKRDEAQGFLDNPAWSPDGKSLYFDSRTYTRDKDNMITGQAYAIYRYDPATKKREKLLDDAHDPAPLPDGKSLVYTSMVIKETSYVQEIKLFDLTTKQSRTLAGLDKNFITVYHPRPSPNGQWIAFAGAGGPGEASVFQGANSTPGAQPISPPTPTPLTSLMGQPLGMLGVLPAPKVNLNVLHGVPYDLWLVKPDGSGLKRMTTLYEDQPMAAWSKDGQEIAFLAGQGFYTIDLAGTNLLKRSDRGAHGGFDWRN